MCQSIRQCSAYGKHPAVRVLVSPDRHVTSGSNVTNACIHSEAGMMDLTWALVRMPPLKLFGVDLFLSEKQSVPGWSGFNAAVLSCVPVLTNIGYCPVIDGSPTESHQQGVPSCNAHSSWMCTQCWTLLGSYQFLKKGPVVWVVLVPSIVSSYCHYCQLQPVQTHKWKCLMVILPQLYHCWQWSHLQC